MSPTIDDLTPPAKERRCYQPLPTPQVKHSVTKISGR